MVGVLVHTYCNLLDLLVQSLTVGSHTPGLASWFLPRRTVAISPVKKNNDCMSHKVNTKSSWLSIPLQEHYSRTTALFSFTFAFYNPFQLTLNIAGRKRNSKSYYRLTTLTQTLAIQKHLCGHCFARMFQVS